MSALGIVASPFRDVIEAAAYLRCSAKTLAMWRCDGTGPKYTKVANRILYRQAWLDEWADKQARQSTAEEPGQ